MPRHSRGFDTDAAHAHLLKRDRKLARWMRRIGPLAPDPRWRKSFDPVDALARAILYQQLSGKAAATITGRVEVAIDSNKLHADTLARIDDPGLRACGVSGNKALALRDLAARAGRGEIPDAKQMATMSEDEKPVLGEDQRRIKEVLSVIAVMQKCEDCGDDQPEGHGTG